MPILYFGSLETYLGSGLRIITVGKNPSQEEFKPGRPLADFARGLSASDVAGDAARGHERYLRALNSYFQGGYYEKWFKNYEKVLAGMSVSYRCGTFANCALHTDLCSPLATTQGYSELDHDTQSAFEKGGVELWCDLIAALRPHAVIMSFAESILSKFCTTPLRKWSVVYQRNGKTTSDFVVRRTRLRIGGIETSVFFGGARQLPFQPLTHAEMKEAGKAIANSLFVGN